jgi:hypothetical protein
LSAFSIFKEGDEDINKGEEDEEEAEDKEE